MSIIVNQVPQDGQSAHFPLWHSVNTNLYADPTLRCVFDIYIGGVMVYRAKVYTRPDMTIHAFYDASPIIRNHFARYFLPAITNTSFLSWDSNGYYIEYQVKYGEEYISATTGLPVASYNQHTTTHRVYNGYPEHLQGGNMVIMPAAFSLLTDRDMDQWWMAPSYHNFIPFRRTPGSNFTMQVVGTGWTATQGYFVSNSPGDLWQFNLSQATINTIPNGGLDDDDDILNIFFSDNLFNSLSFKQKVWCDKRYDPVCVTFLNRYGAYETMVFGLVSKRAIDIEEVGYEASAFQFATASIIPNPPDTSFFVSTARNYDPATKVYYPQRKSSFKKQALSYVLNSDNLTEKNYLWLRQLIASPEVYIERGGYFYPVMITDNRWEEKKSKTDKVFNLTLNIKSFDNIYSQFQ